MIQCLLHYLIDMGVYFQLCIFINLLQHLSMPIHIANNYLMSQKMEITILSYLIKLTIATCLTVNNIIKY